MMRDEYERVVMQDKLKEIKATTWILLTISLILPLALFLFPAIEHNIIIGFLSALSYSIVNLLWAIYRKI